MSHMIRSGWFVLLLAGSLVACAAPATEALPSQTFTSQRFGYTLEVPEGWVISEVSGEWPNYDPVDPRNGIGIDAFKAYIDGKNLAFAVGARALTDGSALEAWKETVKEIIRMSPARSPCFRGQAGVPASEAEVALAGQPAVWIEYLCPEKVDSFGIVVASVYKGQGYWITWVSPQGSEAEFRASFAEILKTFSFTNR